MTHTDYGYGLWGLALVNASVFIPIRVQLLQTRHRARLAQLRRIQRIHRCTLRRNVASRAHHLLALGWLQSHFPGLDWWSHDAGHLLEMMFGWRVNPFWPVPSCQLRADRRGLLADLGRMGAASRSPARSAQRRESMPRFAIRNISGSSS
jgi:hypothetical protein